MLPKLYLLIIDLPAVVLSICFNWTFGNATHTNSTTIVTSSFRGQLLGPMGRPSQYDCIDTGVLLCAVAMAQKCPPPGEGFGICVEACSNDSDCNTGELCCSNGCGRQCMKPAVDPCDNVNCTALKCHQLSPGTITPEGKCCPVCACSTINGSMVAAGTSFMNDCNRCFCGSTGVAGCTLRACLPTTKPPTTSSATSTGTTTTPSPAECPAPGDGFGTCVEACSSDSNCTNGQLCCSNGCGHECMTPVVDPCANVSCPALNCHELSPGTITPEGKCCPVCACSATNGSMVAAGTSFMNDCNRCKCGSTGIAGCTRRACPPPTKPPTTSSTGTTNATLPTPSPAVMCPNASGLIGTCDEQCSSDDECSDGQLCCSNGCGHDCMDTVPDCSAVLCLRPNCTSLSVLVTPKGSCCPVCGCQTPDGEGAAPGETYRPDSCNTCTCFRNGLAACTLAFCPPPTNSTPTPTGSTATPSTEPRQTCPTVQNTTDEYCVDDDECSADDDCQYDRICCSDGCGGRVCSDSVEMCQLIFCAIPRCGNGVRPVTSPFSCCPFCPTTTQNCSVTKVTGKIVHNQRRQRTRLRFSSDGGPGVTYKCKLNDDSFEDCTSPMVWRNLKNGRHTVIVRAICNDGEGAFARKRFRVRVR